MQRSLIVISVWTLGAYSGQHTQLRRSLWVLSSSVYFTSKVEIPICYRYFLVPVLLTIFNGTENRPTTRKIKSFQTVVYSKEKNQGNFLFTKAEWVHKKQREMLNNISKANAASILPLQILLDGSSKGRWFSCLKLPWWLESNRPKQTLRPWQHWST